MTKPTGARGWDGYAATAIADQVVIALQRGSTHPNMLPDRPSLSA